MRLEDALRKSIKESGKTQMELAGATGVSQATLSWLIRSGGKSIYLPTALKLMAYFGYKVTEPDGKEVT